MSVGQSEPFGEPLDRSVVAPVCGSRTQMSSENGSNPIDFQVRRTAVMALRKTALSCFWSSSRSMGNGLSTTARGSSYSQRSQRMIKSRPTPPQPRHPGASRTRVRGSAARPDSGGRARWSRRQHAPRVRRGANDRVQLFAKGDGGSVPGHGRDATTGQRVAGPDLVALILGERYLALVLREYLVHYNRHRPHQSRRQRPPDIETQSVRDVANLRSVSRKPVVSGVQDS